MLTTAKGEENLFDLISSGISDTSFKEILQKEQNPNKVNSENLSLLHFAVLNGLEYHVQILLEAGANQNILDNGFQNPLHYAVIAIVELLINTGADVNIQDFIGNTPLDLAYETESDPIIQTLGMNNTYSEQTYFRLWNECQPVNINVLLLTEEAKLRGITNS